MADQEEELDALLARVTAAVREAFDLGVQFGGLAMRDSILQAAQAPMALKGRSVSLALQVHSDLTGQVETTTRVEAEPPLQRAPRGLVAAFLKEELGARPGQPINALQVAAGSYDAQIAPKTVGNQLRRFEGTYYRRAGRNWFLIDDMKSAEAASPDTSADNLL